VRRLLRALARRRRLERDRELRPELELLRARLEEAMSVKLQAQLAVLAQATAEVVTAELAKERRPAEATGACPCGHRPAGGPTMAQRPRSLLTRTTREPRR
jgi:hypothetical protein